MAMRLLLAAPAALLLCLSACSGLNQPNLARLYRENREVRQPPVVLIHGIMGSRLADRDSGREVWFGNLWRLAFSDYREVALSIDPETLEPDPGRLVPTALTDRIAGRDFYGSIQRTLEQAGGYRRARPGEPQDPASRNYYVFLYDWRLDNARSARLLSRFIDQIRRDYADPNLRVDLIAHSMGGLIARYFIRYGERDVLSVNHFAPDLAGASRVRRVILLGTPNLGSVEALHAFIAGKRVGLRRLPTEVLATMPSVYQTFPHALTDWIVTAEGKPLERDLFDVDIWRRFQWSIFDPRVRERILRQAGSPEEGAAQLAVLERYFEKQLERARRFVWSLTVQLPPGAPPLVVFGGDCQLTPARLVVEEVNGISEVRLWPGEIAHPRPGLDYDALMLEPGDGIVTKASLLARDSLDPSVMRHRYIDFPLAYPLFLCERHDTLTANLTFQDNLLQALLSRDSTER